jgi:hypothetical protein
MTTIPLSATAQLVICCAAHAHTRPPWSTQADTKTPRGGRRDVRRSWCALSRQRGRSSWLPWRSAQRFTGSADRTIREPPALGTSQRTREMAARRKDGRRDDG